jgi:hypothetical protein
MAKYTFLNTLSNNVEEHIVRISDYDSFIKDNPHLQRYFDPSDTLNIIGGVGGIKTDSGFKEVISKVAEAHPSSQLANKTVTRTAAQVKTDQVKKKHGLG